MYLEEPSLEERSWQVAHLNKAEWNASASADDTVSFKWYVPSRHLMKKPFH